MPTIRDARISDARQLAVLQERTFRDTFAATNTKEDLELHCKEHYGEAIQRGEIADLGSHVMICEHEGAFVAFAQLRWTKKPDCVEARHPIEIQRFYVLQDWHGRGLAQQLMQACIDEATRRGADLIWLGVWEHNPRAIAFYKRWGFREAGSHIFPLGTDPQRDIIMTRPAAAATTSR